MKLYAVRIFVTDWERACEFYGDTLGLPCEFREPTLGWAQFDVGGVSLGIESVAEDDEEAARLVGRFVGVSLQVDDLEATHQALSARGVEFTSVPERQPWGGSLAHFRDPDGNVLTLLG